VADRWSNQCLKSLDQQEQHQKQVRGLEALIRLTASTPSRSASSSFLPAVRTVNRRDGFHLYSCPTDFRDPFPISHVSFWNRTVLLAAEVNQSYRESSNDDASKHVNDIMLFEQQNCNNQDNVKAD